MTGNPHEHEDERHRERPRGQLKTHEETGTPDAVEAARVALDSQVDKPAREWRVRGVEWVRPTDLLARHGATLSGRGIDFQAELARRARTTVATGIRGLGERARRLPPLSAFGHSGTSPSGPMRSSVGMSG